MARQNPVLIVGEHDDPHVLSVQAEVERLGAPCFVIDEDVTPIRVAYSGQAYTAEAKFRVGWTPLGSVQAVWWWRKETTIALAHRADFAADFAMREYRDVLESLEWIVPAAWPIRPSVIRRASLKCRQLAVAQELGFRIPTTIVTNDVGSILDYVEERPSSFKDGLLYKPLTWYVGPPDRFLYSTRVTEGDVADSARAVGLAPCQFQAYVPKSYELRVAVAGKSMFPIRIDSQAREDTEVDWRRNQEEVAYEITDLPRSLVARLRRYMTVTEASFGSFDLIVSRDGSVTFLEFNPMGQWLWLEERLGIRVSAAIATLLVST